MWGMQGIWGLLTRLYACKAPAKSSRAWAFLALSSRSKASDTRLAKAALASRCSFEMGSNPSTRDETIGTAPLGICIAACDSLGEITSNAMASPNTHPLTLSTSPKGTGELVHFNWLASDGCRNCWGSRKNVLSTTMSSYLESDAHSEVDSALGETPTHDLCLKQLGCKSLTKLGRWACQWCNNRCTETLVVFQFGLCLPAKLEVEGTEMTTRKEAFKQLVAPMMGSPPPHVLPNA